MYYFVDFSGWSEQEIKDWLTENSKPIYSGVSNWEINAIASRVNEYKDLAISFNNKDLKVYTGYCYADWYRNRSQLYTEVKINKTGKVSIRDFYSGKPLTLKNGESLTLTQILNKDNNWWDECHDFIQWLFPTVTVSKHCKDAPILTKEDAAWLLYNHQYLINAVYQRFYKFLDSQDMTLFNHNHLRFTRALEFNSLLNDVSSDETLFNIMEFFRFCSKWLPMSLGETPDGTQQITSNPETFKFWVDALYAKFA